MAPWNQHPTCASTSPSTPSCEPTSPATPAPLSSPPPTSGPDAGRCAAGPPGSSASSSSTTTPRTRTSSPTCGPGCRPPSPSSTASTTTTVTWTSCSCAGPTPLIGSPSAVVPSTPPGGSCSRCRSPFATTSTSTWPWRTPTSCALRAPLLGGRGVVLYQFLTGRLPYQGSSLTELAVRGEQEAAAADTYVGGVPETLGGAVLRALEGDPTRRSRRRPARRPGSRLGMEGGDVTLPLERERRRPTCSVARPRAAAAPRHRPDRVPAGAQSPPGGRCAHGAAAAGARHRRRPGPGPGYAQAQACSRFTRFVLASRRARPDRPRGRRRGDLTRTDQATGVKATEVTRNTLDKVVEEFGPRSRKTSDGR